jgi:hemerythrin-like domain-containing protein
LAVTAGVGAGIAAGLLPLVAGATALPPQAAANMAITMDDFKADLLAVRRATDHVYERGGNSADPGRSISPRRLTRSRVPQSRGLGYISRMLTSTRRTFLTAAGSGALLVGCSHASHAARPGGGEEAEAEGEEVTPAEDLMREHGVLRRVMYMYGEASMRLESQRDVPLDAVGSCADIVRHVIEDYHEKLEEQFLFPRFEAARKLADLTAVLRRQHKAGRTVTDQIIALVKAPLADADRAKLAALLRRFNHMYRAHAAREDTVLFPALRGLVGASAYAELGEQFEDKEHEMLGEHGFEGSVARVAKLEQAFGVDDLAQLTA